MVGALSMSITVGTLWAAPPTRFGMLELGYGATTGLAPIGAAHRGPEYIVGRIARGLVLPLPRYRIAVSAGRIRVNFPCIPRVCVVVVNSDDTGPFCTPSEDSSGSDRLRTRLRLGKNPSTAYTGGLRVHTPRGPDSPAPPYRCLFTICSPHPWNAAIALGRLVVARVQRLLGHGSLLSLLCPTCLTSAKLGVALLASDDTQPRSPSHLDKNAPQWTWA